MRLRFRIINFLWKFRWFRESVKRNLQRQSLRESEFAVRSTFERYSDEVLEATIIEFSERKSPYWHIVEDICNFAGTPPETVKQWLETERFVREHRRRYAKETTA